MEKDCQLTIKFDYKTDKEYEQIKEETNMRKAMVKLFSENGYSFIITKT